VDSEGSKGAHGAWRKGHGLGNRVLSLAKGKRMGEGTAAHISRDDSQLGAQVEVKTQKSINQTSLRKKKNRHKD